MRNTWGSIIIALALASGGACKDDQKTPTDSEADALLKELTGHKDKVCACPDRECAIAAAEPAGALEAEVKAKFPDPTPEQRQRFGAVVAELTACIRDH